ncbi:MAG: hypothetical protein COV72_00955 [Candidatus Omnitrophica bacterium CG11_big_fil_rev_8_21_14_0_20_42_13]|uniref:Methyltransferase domain-containing protein n=1 Tax=Candidatus Ghiorseimicrobium undicola TaxID=1974746 RepID=A0A2H0LZT1_9BACT|nr:MAG: hypothetical protein COV72_00955 [Candidatus Omnitrophica bacterium CG11_big_fil_rev_8_21_14_0_20_42_13]
MALSGLKFNLFAEVKPYLRLREELISYLSKHPNDWSKFQKNFNATLDKIYNDISQLEKDNFDKLESSLYKLKKIFEKRYRRYFLCGEFIKHSFEKPFGYAGDFKIIDEIYQNNPCTTGFDRLWDNYFQQLSASNAIRERKEDFKKIIFNFARKFYGQEIRIMNLACGPAREIKELIQNDTVGIFSKTIFDCYDFEKEAINYAQNLLNASGNINFIQKNAIRLALNKNIKKEITHRYNLIYSAGLFDYLDKRIAIKLLSNLKQLLKKDGAVLIANAGDKYNNASAAWMEWVAEWHLIYRSEENFKKLFIDASFSQNNLQIMLQHNSRMMLYALAKIA